MLRSRPPRDRERGSAALELLTLGVLLLVPLVYLVLLLADLQGAAFGAEGAARQAARVYVTAETDDDASSAMADAIRTGLADWGVAPSASAITMTCTPNPTACRTPGGTVRIGVRVAVALPLLPPALAVNAPGTVAVGATATQRVSEYVARR